MYMDFKERSDLPLLHVCIQQTAGGAAASGPKIWQANPANQSNTLTRQHHTSPAASMSHQLELPVVLLPLLLLSPFTLLLGSCHPTNHTQ
jgi:hypothetical protein